MARQATRLLNITWPLNSGNSNKLNTATGAYLHTNGIETLRIESMDQENRQISKIINQSTFSSAICWSIDMSIADGNDRERERERK